MRIVLSLLLAGLAAATEQACQPTRVMDALRTSHPRAKRFCNAFTAVDDHTWYPAFIATACDQPTHPPKLTPAGNAAIDDSILSSACTQYMAAIATDAPPASVSENNHGFDDSWSVLEEAHPDPGHHESGPLDGKQHNGEHHEEDGEDEDGNDDEGDHDEQDPPADQAPGAGKEPPAVPLQPLPQATLIPVLHINHDLGDINNLKPQSSAALFYAEQSYKTNPFLKHMYADMNVSFSYPTVVIDSTHFLNNMACHLSSNDTNQTGGTLVYEVETKAAFDMIDETWPREKDLVLVLQGEDCERTEDGSRAYFLGYLDSLSWSDEEEKGMLEFIGDEILLEEGITNASLEWGTRVYNQDAAIGPAMSQEAVNQELCGKASPYRKKAIGVPAVNPCAASFDLALDQAAGYSYVPVAARYDRTRQLLVNAEAREDLIVDYINTQLGTASFRIRWRRFLGFGTIWRGTRSLGDAVWQGIVEVGRAFDAAGDKSLNCFRNLPVKTSAAAKRIGRMVYDGLRTAGPAIIDNYKSLRTYIIKSAQSIGRLGIRGLTDLDRRIQSWNPNLNVDYNIDLAPPRLTESPWGDAWLLVKIVTNSPRQPKGKALSPPSGPPPPALSHEPHRPPPPPSMGHAPLPPQLPKPHAPFKTRHDVKSDRDDSVEGLVPRKLSDHKLKDEHDHPPAPGYRTGDPIGGEKGKHSRHGTGHDHFREPHRTGPSGDDEHCSEKELRKRALCNRGARCQHPHHSCNPGQPIHVQPHRPDHEKALPDHHEAGKSGEAPKAPVVEPEKGGKGEDTKPGKPEKPKQPDDGQKDGKRDGQKEPDDEDGDGENGGDGNEDGDGDENKPGKGGEKSPGGPPGKPSDPGMRMGDPGKKTKPKPVKRPDPGYRIGDGFTIPKRRIRGTRSRSRASRATKKGTRQRQFKLYCVGCGLHAHNKVSGQARFSILHGAQALNIGLDGRYQYGMGIGMQAEQEKNVPGKQRNIIPPISTPLTTVKGVMTFGPIMSLAVGVASNTKHSGQIAAGVNMNVPSYTASFDFVHPSNSQIKGFRTSTVHRYFNANAAMSQVSNVNMPFSMGVGVMIPAIKLDKRAKLVNRPNVNIQAVLSGTYAKGSKSSPPGLSLPPDSKCDGMTYAVNFAHEIDFVMLDRYTKNVMKFQAPVKKGCFKPGAPKQGSPGKPPHLSLRSSKQGWSDSKLDFNNDDEEGLDDDDISSRSSPDLHVDEDTISFTLDSANNAHILPASAKKPSPKTPSSDPTVTDGTDIPASHFRDLGSSWGPVIINSPPAYLDRPKLIVDSTRSMALISALDGNIYLLPFQDALRVPERNASLVFSDLTHVGPRWVNPAVKNRFVGSHARTLMTDGFDRGFHYFPATLAKYGVSRVRMADVDTVPSGAAQTIMEYGKLGKNGQLGFYFVDSASPFTAAFPVACLVSDAQGTELPKLFAVGDVTKGLAALNGNKELASAMTGGTVRECQFVHLVEVLCDSRGKDPRECQRWQAGASLPPDE